MWYSRQKEKPAPPPPTSVEPFPPPRAIANTPPETPARHESKVGAGLRIKGEVEGREDLRVDGRIEGPVRLAGGRITVSENGSVSGTIEAREIVVHGAVRGKLTATDRIEIGATGVLQGDLAAGRLRIDEGARVRGRVMMGSEEDHRKRRSPEPRENNPALFSVPEGKIPSSQQ